MRLFAGTSGYSYKEWKGSFYPADLPADQMLRSYAERLPAVEINNTFYRLPSAAQLESWAGQVPAGFRFAVKASRRITHIKRLKEAHDETGYLLRTLNALGPRLGVVLFQLPPNMKKDLGRLGAFLDLLTLGPRAAFEFRHPSWMDADVEACLRDRGCAWCVADDEDGPEPQVVSTGRLGYLRLRRPGYDDAALARWAAAVAARDWDEAYVFFKHEDEGAGPALAQRFLELAAAPHKKPAAASVGPEVRQVRRRA
jgi:uncharacterized protein YecE (DUF72 family)